MQSLAFYMTGFKRLCSLHAGCSAASPIKTIEELTVERLPCSSTWLPPSQSSPLRDGQVSIIAITVRAKSFLYHQVRLMVAWLVEVGSERREAQETAEVLAERDVRALGCQMAPAYGLYLADVCFDEEELQDWNRQQSPRSGSDD
jgi:tRNA pseudouridine38-40 synthase